MGNNDGKYKTEARGNILHEQNDAQACTVGTPGPELIKDQRPTRTFQTPWNFMITTSMMLSVIVFNLVKRLIALLKTRYYKITDIFQDALIRSTPLIWSLESANLIKLACDYSSYLKSIIIKNKKIYNSTCKYIFLSMS